MYAAAARVEDVRGDRRQLHRAGHHPRAAPPSRPTPWTATSTSAAPTRIPAAAGTPAATSSSARSTSAARAEPLADEAVALLSAPQCPSGRFTIVLDPSQLYLQVHESCGHPTELDRVYGTEASLRRDELPDHGQARRGVPLRLRPHRRSSPTRPRPAAWARSAGTTRAWRRSPCRSIQDGILVGYLSSRETAPRDRAASGGAMRADGWNRIPLIRMTNINLLPKPGMSLDEIVADTDDGLYLVVEPLLVDRRPAAQLPVRHRGRLRDQGRQEGPAVQEPDLHRHHLRVLALVRRGRRRVELRDARHAQLRQGRAGPDRATSATPSRAPASANVQVGVGKW